MGCCVSAPESARRENDYDNRHHNAPTVVHRAHQSILQQIII
jgi:hypothetical protein